MPVIISEEATDNSIGRVNIEDFLGMQVEFGRYVTMKAAAGHKIVPTLYCFFKKAEIVSLINSYTLRDGEKDGKNADGFTFFFSVMPTGVTSCEKIKYDNFFCITAVATSVDDQGKHSYYMGLNDRVLIPGFKQPTGEKEKDLINCCGSIHPPIL